MSAPARSTRYTWRTALVVVVVVGGWWTATHGVAGVGWLDVTKILEGVRPWRLGVLAAIWLGGLGIYSLVLSAALPGLGVRRSLLLNLSGSAVANVVPLGGAVATALNWRMVRAWGHSDRSFAAFCILTNALDLTTKLVLPLVAVATLMALSLHVPTVLWAVAASCVAALAIAAVARVAARRLRGWSRVERPWRTAVDRYLHDAGGRVQDLVVGQWPRLVPASIGYVAAQVLLLFVALQSVGLDAPVPAVLTAAAIERLGTLVPVTPGGTGVAEIGAIAWLVATGLNPAQVVAGVLLYRVFLVAMEVHLGGILLGVWTWTQRTTARRTTAVVAP